MFESTSRALRWARAVGVATLCGASLALAVAAPQATPVAAVKSKAAATRTATPDEAAMRERIAKAPQGVAGLHRTSSGALKCDKCHGDTVAPDDNQTVENRECIACHGDYAQVSAELAKKNAGNKSLNKHIDPHASHLGPEIACTTCHQGHQESKAYCVHCHTNFQMPMPGNAPAARR